MLDIANMLHQANESQRRRDLEALLTGMYRRVLDLLDSAQGKPADSDEVRDFHYAVQRFQEVADGAGLTRLDFGRIVETARRAIDIEKMRRAGMPTSAIDKLLRSNPTDVRETVGYSVAGK